MALLTDPDDRRLIALAIPALGTLAIEPLYVVVDTAIVGHLGTAPLAGLALAAGVLLIVTAGCNFLAYGTAQRVAFHRGGGRMPTADAVAVQALWLSVLVGVPVAAVVGFGARVAAHSLGGSGDVLDAATTYLRIAAVGIPAILVALAGTGVLRGHADLRTPLVIVTVANVANVVLEIVTVYVMHLGIAGSAWSTVVVQVVAGGAYLAVLRPRLSHPVSRRIDLVEMRPLLTAGRHLLLRVGAMLAVFTSTTAIAARIDKPTLAAHQVTSTMFSLLALALDALAIPAHTMMAEALGGGDPTAAMRMGRRVVRLSLWAGVVIAGGLAATSWLIARVFSHDSSVISRATVGLLVLSLVLIPGGLVFGLDGVLIGAGDYRFLGRAAAGELLGFLPFGALALAVPGLGIAGVWGAVGLWMVLRAIVKHHRFVSEKWLSVSTT